MASPKAQAGHDMPASRQAADLDPRPACLLRQRSSACGHDVHASHLRARRVQQPRGELFRSVRGDDIRLLIGKVPQRMPARPAGQPHRQRLAARLVSEHDQERGDRKPAIPQLPRPGATRPIATVTINNLPLLSARRRSPRYLQAWWLGR